ncbi:phosphatase PAP2 family protein [Paenibacillus sp. 2TAB19]|uniref:phosphatase PAP2 family protein n=1 Tax=Paenibacillus sp. 2TAB19 TaxID=3233003 RepID=UPI003F964DF1
MQTKGSKRFMLGLFLGWAALMLVFSFADMSLSKAVYNETHSRFGAFFENFGEHPAFMIFFIAGNILFRNARDKSFARKLAIRIASAFFMGLGGIGMIFIGVSRQFGWDGGSVLLTSVVAVIIVSVIVQLLLNRVPDEKIKVYNMAAWAGIGIVFTEMIVVNVLKIFWGRMRFRNMNGDYSQFTNWFLPNGIQKNGVTAEVFKSFPSGHSANGWTMLVWMLFMPFVKIWRNTMLIIAIAWGLCTSYSRIVMGDHFATDVLFGAFITACSMIVWCKWLKIELYADLQAGSSRHFPKDVTPS